jgi:chromosome segregation ATPase
VAANPTELDAFRNSVAELSRKIHGVNEFTKELRKSLDEIEHALINYPNTDLTLKSKVDTLQLSLESCDLILNGDLIKTSHEFETEPSLNSRIELLMYQLYDNTTGVSNTQKAYQNIILEEYQMVKSKLEKILERYTQLESKLADIKLPYNQSIGNSWKNHKF